MKRAKHTKELLQTLELLTDHRRRAATVAALLEHCEGSDLEAGLLAEAGGIIGDELRAIRECTKTLHREIVR